MYEYIYSIESLLAIVCEYTQYMRYRSRFYLFHVDVLINSFERNPTHIV